jgi:hypothetical protein
MKRLLMAAAAVLIAAAGSARAADDSELDTQEEAFQKAMETQGSFNPELKNPRVVKMTSRAVTNPELLRGTVTLVGDDVIRLVELETGIEREVNVTDAQEKSLSTGYAIKARIRNGRLLSYTEIGVPPHVADIVYTSENLPTDNVLEDYYDTGGFLN